MTAIYAIIVFLTITFRLSSNTSRSCHRSAHYKNLNKTYKKSKVKVLDDFSAELTSGIYGLLGPNGAGKSTLMHIITDNLNADSGEVLFDGKI